MVRVQVERRISRRSNTRSKNHKSAMEPAKLNEEWVSRVSETRERPRERWYRPIERTAFVVDGVNEWKRRSGETRSERRRLVPEGIDPRDFFHLRRPARRSNFRRRPTAPYTRGCGPYMDGMFSAGCILNVFTFGSWPCSNPRVSSLCATGISARTNTPALLLSLIPDS